MRQGDASVSLNQLDPIDPSPKELRKAFVARLISKGIAGGAIHSARVTGFPKGEVPAVNVFSLGSESVAKSHHASYDRTARITCAATVAVPDGTALDDIDEALADLVDDMEEAIKDAIQTWRELRYSIQRWEGMTAVKGGSGEGENLRGHVSIEFRFPVDEEYTFEAPLPDDGTLDQIRADVIVADGTPVTELRMPDP